ncbi:MAG: ectoine hydroxylase [Pseudohongiella sp.]|nr:ectoine hydroxylase [Pseudohongiella sp.]
MSELIFEPALDDLVASEVDVYASRNENNAKLIDRQDPIVYASKEQPSPLDRSLIDTYNEQGFVVLDGVFSPDEVATFQQELECLRTDSKIQKFDEVVNEPNSNDLRSIFRVHESNPLFKALAVDERLADLARYLLDDEVYIHQSRLNYKPGFRGKEFYWHSDFETWHVEDGMPRMRALSMSITLTENFDCNGSLMLIPGSHKKYVVCVGETPEKHYLASLKKQEHGVPSDACLKTLAAQGGIVSAIGKPGSVIVFDCNVMHGSNGNITPFPRSNVFFVYNALSNKVVNPFCAQAPRPEYICSRESIHLVPRSHGEKLNA